MAQEPKLDFENNFSNGLVTEATGINFPEHACTETYDCEFRLDGSVKRRLGFDFESGYATKTIDRSNSAITTYLWKNVSGNGDLSLVVVQVGATLYFYKVVADTGFSAGAITSTVTLTAVSGAGTITNEEAQFTDGNGYLFVTHPHCEPIRVSYDTSSDTATGTDITIKVRDFEGATADSNAVDTRPTASLASLDANHKYNLYNQGWNTTNLTAWDTAQATMPSNADVMWRFKDSSENFDASNAAIARVVAGNTPAPKGHFVLTLSNQDRDTAAGTSGVTATTTGHERPSTCAFHSGRVFYAGINYTGVNTNIYFTQIIERNEQYGFCHQINDPTSEDLFDLLPSDGGVISIPQAGTIFKLVSVPSGLAVFGAKGVWFITGSTGIGFTANDYSVQQIAEIPTLSASSFVSVMGFPVWWNERGIYTLTPQESQAQGSLPIVKSLTDGKIKEFFLDIPLNSKRYAKGMFHYFDNHIRWIYRSEGTTEVTQQYEYDRILNFNIVTGAFYPWTIPDSDVKIHGIIRSDLVAGTTSVSTVVNGADTVIDASGNTVITFTNTGTETSPFDKYLVSYSSAGSHAFTFVDKSNADYLDFFQYDNEGVDYTSYLITGYKLPGGGIRKFQSNWVRVFSRTDEAVAYTFQGIWDYATVGSTGRWSTSSISHLDTSYSRTSARIKVRGHGLTLQFKIASSPGEPFHVEGWSVFETINQVP